MTSFIRRLTSEARRITVGSGVDDNTVNAIKDLDCMCRNKIATGSVTQCTHCTAAPLRYNVDVGGIIACDTALTGIVELVYQGGCTWSSASAICSCTIGTAVTTQWDLVLTGTDYSDATLTIDFGDGKKIQFENLLPWGCLCRNRMVEVCTETDLRCRAGRCTVCIAPIKDGDVVTNCCADGVPESLLLEVNDEDANCACGDSAENALVYDSDVSVPDDNQWYWRGLMTFCSTSIMTELRCDDGTWRLTFTNTATRDSVFREGGQGGGCGPALTNTCDPLNVDFGFSLEDGTDTQFLFDLCSLVAPTTGCFTASVTE